MSKTQIPVSKTFFSGVQQDPSLPQNNVFLGGSCGSSSRRPWNTEAIFDGVYQIERVTLDMAGSDMTADQSRIRLLARLPDGGYQDLMPPVVGKGINRGQPNTMSQDNPDPPRLKSGFMEIRDYLEPLDLAVEIPVAAVGIALWMEGHGWFAAQDLKAFGTRAEDLPEAWEDYPDGTAYQH